MIGKIICIPNKNIQNFLSVEKIIGWKVWTLIFWNQPIKFFLSTNVFSLTNEITWIENVVYQIQTQRRLKIFEWVA